MVIRARCARKFHSVSTELPALSPFWDALASIPAQHKAPDFFSALAPCTRIDTTLTCAPGDRFGNVGRNVLRGDGISNGDLSVSKTTRVFRRRHTLQFRADFFDLTNTRNFGIPEARITNPGFLDEGSTDGGNRRIFLGLKYSF